MHTRAIGVAPLLIVLAACKHGSGPHLMLMAPSAPLNLGDTTSRVDDPRSFPSGGGGRAGAPGRASSGGTPIAPIVGGIVGAGATAAAVGAGMITCNPDADDHSSSESHLNLCSGERRPAMLAPLR